MSFAVQTVCYRPEVTRSRQCIESSSAEAIMTNSEVVQTPGVTLPESPASTALLGGYG